MTDYGYEHPESEGAIYVRKHSKYKYRDGNTGEVGRSKAEVKARNRRHYMGRPQTQSGVGVVNRERTVEFPGLKQSYIVVRKKKRR